MLGTGWTNTELRSYEFSKESDEDAPIVETAASRERRRGTEKPLSRTEQMELRKTTEKTWESGGIQIRPKAKKDDRDWIGAF